MPSIAECGFFLSDSGYAPDIQRECIGDEEDEDSRTEIIQSVSEIGDAVDFLKAHPFISMEEYKWQINPAMVKIMSIDNTHIRHISEKEAAMRKSKIIDGNGLMNDLGMPIL